MSIKLWTIDLWIPWAPQVVSVNGRTGVVTGLAEANAVVDLTTAQTKAWVLTFTDSPVVPTPTTDFQAATKKYVDDNAWGGISEVFEASMSADYNLTTSFAIFPFNTENIDTWTNYNNATYQYTAPSSWNYFFSSFWLVTGLTSLDSVQYWFYLNWTVVKAFNNIAAGTTQCTAWWTCILPLTIWDVVDVRWRNWSAARWALRNLTNSNFCWYKLN